MPQQIHKHTFVKIAIVGVPLIVAGILIFKGIKSAKAANANNNPLLIGGSNNPIQSTYQSPIGGLTTTINTTPAATDSFPLKMGSKGNNVKLLQQSLNTWVGQLGQSIAIDGIFGSKTEAALLSKTGKKTVDSQQELDIITGQGKTFLGNILGDIGIKIL